MESTAEKKIKKKRTPLLILAIVLVGAAVFGINKYIYSIHHVDTDDAQLDADISPVLARVSGYVNEIRFEENQRVNKGDTLVKLDDRDLLIKVDQAQAALDNAKVSVQVARANAGTAHANIATASSGTEAAKVRVWKATQDYNRYENLLKEKATSQLQFDAIKAEKLSAEAQLEATKKEESAAALQSNSVSQQVAVAQSTVAQREADLAFAKLQLSYATITAPASGLVSRKNIQTGQFVNAGSPLFAIVSEEGMYVIANFKETQLDKMKI
ncbi:MAG: HlyD family secretion protein [Bacteroidota bacterium]